MQLKRKMFALKSDERGNRIRIQISGSKRFTLLICFLKDAASIKLYYFQNKKNEMKKGKAAIPSINNDMRCD